MKLEPINYSQVPNKQLLSDFVDAIKDYLFPNYFSKVDNIDDKLEDCKKLFLLAVSNDETKKEKFFASLDEVKEKLLKDLEFFYESDPASKSYEEIVVTYPGFYAIMVYRISHLLNSINIPLIPRFISEVAHSRTGIDIHPGATIGEYFFIDHGTGIVIGETTIIGHHVKMYQGVTLGALSLGRGRALKNDKRHPTIGNYVTLYAGANVLGGDTEIGDNVTIGSAVFLTKSIPSNTLVVCSDPKLIIKDKSNA